MKARGLVRAGALLAAVWALGMAGRSTAWAQTEPAPLAEMRAAAEVLADVDPEAGGAPRRDTLPPKAQAPGGAQEKESAKESTRDGAKDHAKDGDAASHASVRAELHAAVRSAVQSEITREVQSISRSANGLALGRANKESGEPARGEAAHANEAAAQAQQARLNREVNQGRGRMYGKPLVGNPSTGAPQAGRAQGK